MRLSKSRFVAGVQCLKRLYWQIHEPELAEQPDDSTEAILEQGQEVGRLACLGFPGGVKVEHGRENLEEAIRQTRDLISNPEISAIFEATFEHDGVLVRVDVLQRRPRKKWRLIEVKSTAGLKDQHLYDVAVQNYVVSRCGLDLSSACLMHLNRGYVYQGGEYDVHRLFRIRNLNRQIAKLDGAIERHLRTQFQMLSEPDPPNVVPGRQYREPVFCEFFARCNAPVPADHVSYLPRVSVGVIEKLAGMGVQSIHDIPEDFPLRERLRIACTSVQTGTPWYSAELSKELESLHYPLYFMDFETVNPAIPRLVGMRPFDQLPFQWSVHIQRQPQSELEHYEFLANSEADPHRDFIASLCSVLGDEGSIVVYNLSFESQRLSDLARRIPEFATRINSVQTRLWDLLPIVRKYVYHPEFGGSFSLKAVLPALLPELSYENMEVANGRAAGLAWESLIHGDLDAEVQTRVRNGLLAYCCQDTLALVRLLEKLKENSLA